MFSKRPRRDKLLVAITALVGATALAVPIGLAFGLSTTAPLKPVTVQPLDVSETSVTSLTYGTAYEEPPAPAPLSAEFVLGSKRTLVTAGEGPIAAGSIVGAGTEWSVVFTFVPAPGYAGNNYAHTFKYRVVPAPVSGAPITDKYVSSVVYGSARMMADTSDLSIFPLRNGYARPVYVSAGTITAAQQPSAAVPLPANTVFETLQAGTTVVLVYEMNPDPNHTGSKITINVVYAIARAQITNPPPSSGPFAATTPHGGAFVAPQPTTEQAAAVRNAGYNDFTAAYSVVSIAPGFSPPQYRAGSVISAQEIKLLQTGSVVRATLTSTFDKVSDPNHDGPVVTITYEYTVVKGDFNSGSPRWNNGDLSSEDVPVDSTPVDPGATDFPPISKLFKAKANLNVPDPYVNYPEADWKPEFFLMKATTEDKIPVKDMQELRTALAANKDLDGYLHVRLPLGFDQTNWTFNGSDSGESFYLETRVLLAAASGTGTNP